jgi:RHS repeat-associated protein
VNFRANGAAITVLESMHYYPFGMLMEGIGTNTPTNDYTYNYKELNEDFGLNLYDYGARWYDASLGRWWSVDPMAEKYGRWSGYNYGLCNPVKFIDPDGRSVTTDYYNEKGSKLGTDGNDNGKMVVVTDKKEAKSIKKTDEAGGTTA